MAKKTKFATEPESSDLPESLEVDVREPRHVDVAADMPEAREMVTLTLNLPRYRVVAVAPEHTYRLDRQRYLDSENGAAALLHTLLYGEGRFTRDGTTKVSEGEGDDRTTRDATPEERVALASEKWDRRFAGTLKTREGSAADPLLAESRAFAINALKNRGRKLKEIGKLPDWAAIESVLAFEPGLFEKVKSAAKRVVDARGAESI